MSTPPQIKKNAQWVIENVGPASGLSNFGYDADSIAYLDSYLERHNDSFRASEQSTDRIVSMLGAFLGEAIIARYGGEWHQTAEGISLEVQSGGQFHILRPFHKVHKRVMNGAEHSLHFYFSTFLPQVLSRSEPEDPHRGPSDSKGGSRLFTRSATGDEGWRAYVSPRYLKILAGVFLAAIVFAVLSA